MRRALVILGEAICWLVFIGSLALLVLMPQ